MRSGPGRPKLRHANVTPGDRMNIHNNARLTPKGQEGTIKGGVAVPFVSEL
jgi:hypothetical protein